MKKFQNGGGWGKSFMYQAMREKHRENRQMRKTGRERAFVSSRTDVAFTVHFTAETASRHLHLSFPQMCLSLLITVVSVFEDDLIGFIYMIMKPPLLRVNDASLPFPIRLHQALFECFWLLASAHLPLLTGICNESLLNNREKQLTHNLASYSPAEMKNLFVRQENVRIYVLC